MNTKQRDILNNPDPVNTTAARINGNPIINEISGKIDSKATDSESQLLMRLKEAEEINSNLYELVEIGRKKLNETIAADARFLKLIAHDLRNPFSTTIGILDLLKESLNDWNKSDVEHLIATALNSSLRAIDLLDNLLAWSMIQTSENNFNPVKIHLRELVINELEGLNDSATLKQISMDQSIDPDLLVTADFEMVKTIFRNLIGNAIKYTHNGGHIYIGATEGKRFVKIEVRDNGIGMSQKTMEKLFKIDEFRSIMGTNNERGNGLGLLFCKEFIDLHGGKIQVESEPDKGSKFKFTLPHHI
jgi:signal transduction histidine kinase